MGRKDIATFALIFSNELFTLNLDKHRIVSPRDVTSNLVSVCANFQYCQYLT